MTENKIFQRWSYLSILIGIIGIPGHSNINVEASTLERRIVNSAPKADMFDLFHVMPSGKVEMMLEWDLLLSMEEYQQLYGSGGKRNKRKALREVNKRWTDCFVYYEITDSLDTSHDREVIKEAMAEWEKFTCLNFIEDYTKEQRIQFKDGGGCYSKLGMQDEPQPLVLARGCRTKGTVAHEIGHAIGWIHEHMRPDRDEYIYVNLDAVDPVHHDNYRKYDASAINTYDVPYDYNSLMHYGNGVFPGSLLALDPQYQEVLGQREGLSFKDIKLANVMYDCAKMFCSRKLDCKDGFQMPKEYKGKPKCQCWCDSGKVDDPLILCSERATVPPPPEPTSKPTVMPQRECDDVREDCSTLKQLGHCITKMGMMVRSCMKTCDFCGKGEGMCMDYDKGCPLLAASGSCEKEGLREKMAEICKLSCNLCDGPEPPTPCEIEKEMMGDQALTSYSSSSTSILLVPLKGPSLLLSLAMSVLFLFH